MTLEMTLIAAILTAAFALIPCYLCPPQAASVVSVVRKCGKVPIHFNAKDAKWENAKDARVRQSLDRIYRITRIRWRTATLRKGVHRTGLCVLCVSPPWRSLR